MSLETRVIYLDGVRFQAIAGNNQITCDQPLENGGTDRGMSPPELFLASLGSCAAYYAVEYLRARSIAAVGLTVTVTAQKAQNPARLTGFKVGVNVPNLKDERHRDGVLRAVKTCLIHNTLLRAPTIDVELETNTAVMDQPSSEVVRQ